jgi:dipeptidyl aminopeptidase/acylaminoacyl peptidase
MKLAVMIVPAVVLVVAVGAGIYFWHHHAKRPQPVTSPHKTTQAAAPKPALNPLEIAAITARQYTASTLTVTQDLGEQGGYRNAIVSFVSDGLTEYALQSTPDGTAPSGGWPVIILDHGYENPATYTTNDGEYADFIAAFARAGYMVIKPDYRGYGQSQGQPAGGHFSPDYTYDELNLIATLKASSVVNAKRIGLFAHSMGGHVALNTIVVSKDVKATVIMNGVVGSFYDIFYNWPSNEDLSDQPSALVQGTRQALITAYGTPKTNPTFWGAGSAINYVSNVVGPVEVDQDAGDTTVPKLMSDHLVAALQAAHKAVTYYIYPGDDHQMSSPANHDLVISRAVAFYQAHL